MSANSCSRRQNKLPTYNTIISYIDVITFSSAINISTVCKRNTFAKVNWNGTKNTFKSIVHYRYTCFNF